MPRIVLPIVLAGALLALGGAYWDDAWHTERGRDSFFVAPHLLLYAGVGLAGGGVALWLARDRGATLAALGLIATLLAAPVDEAWHQAFGRDAVIWSPPHLLGIAGTATLAAAVLAARPGPLPAGALLAACAFVVSEYDTDVPQFDPALWLPVLTGVSAYALALARMAGVRAAHAAVAHLVFVTLVAGALSIGGFGAPMLPLLLVPALVLDLRPDRPWSGAAYALALYATYVPVTALLDGVRLDAGDVLLGLPLAVLVATAILTPLRRALVPAAAAAALVGAPGAVAHDPGQGDDAGRSHLTVSARGLELRLRADWQGECGALAPVAVVARRAGETARGPLRARGCRYEGAVRVPERGRWFVYAQWRRGKDPVEAWLPVKVEPGRDARAVERDRFAYVPAATDAGALQAVAGALLGAATLALLVAAAALVRRSRVVA